MRPLLASQYLGCTVGALVKAAQVGLVSFKLGPGQEKLFSREMLDQWSDQWPITTGKLPGVGANLNKESHHG